MIHIDNKLKALSPELIKAARGMLENTAKGDSRPTSVKEDVEQIDELSLDTLQSYRQKSKNDPAFEKRKGKISAVRKAIMTKRTKGQEMASKKIKAKSEAEWLEHRGVQNDVSKHLKSKANEILTKHGFVKSAENHKRSIYVKGDNDAGVVHTVTVHKDYDSSSNSPHHISSFHSTTGWQGSEDRYYADHHFPRGLYKKEQAPELKRAAEQDYAEHLKKRLEYHNDRGLREAKTAEGSVITEALKAADRYNDHYTSIKSLLKSISQHVDSHKADSFKSRNYQGQKGVDWGHVGDLAGVHSQLADIHDRLAQQGEYKRVIGIANESAEIVKEARGRPRKNPLPTGQTEEPEPRQHIIQQLQRAKLSMRGGEHVTFKDGTKHHITGAQASKLLDKYSGMKPFEKEAFQKKIGASHAACKEEM